VSAIDTEIDLCGGGPTCEVCSMLLATRAAARAEVTEARAAAFAECAEEAERRAAAVRNVGCNDDGSQVALEAMAEWARGRR
jgi:hypothetical protein